MSFDYESLIIETEKLFADNERKIAYFLEEEFDAELEKLNKFQQDERYKDNFDQLEWIQKLHEELDTAWNYEWMHDEKTSLLKLAQLMNEILMDPNNPETNNKFTDYIKGHISASPPLGSQETIKSILQKQKLAWTATACFLMLGAITPGAYLIGTALFFTFSMTILFSISLPFVLAFGVALNIAKNISLDYEKHRVPHQKYQLSDCSLGMFKSLQGRTDDASSHNEQSEEGDIQLDNLLGQQIDNGCST